MQHVATAAKPRASMACTLVLPISRTVDHQACTGQFNSARPQEGLIRCECACHTGGGKS